MKSIAFLFSGRGSLLTSVQGAINDAPSQAKLGLVLTNNRDFSPEGNPIFDSVVVTKITHHDYKHRYDFEEKIAEKLIEADVDLIILGGFRRIFSPEFVGQFGYKTMNTHPSLLPAFPGDKAQLKALQAGLRVTGATLHFINDDVDAGPIVDQEPVRITNGMTESQLREDIIEAEKKMIYNAIRAFLSGKIKIVNDKVIYEGYADVQDKK
ncbi:phosphoribosylglycinamide formyltransferase [Pectobacterium parvum]|uniref:Phosphoribosylglycinamide formyltransferase n=1 Tax=Pectobacterium parvum TaxID=2778550 RepID=A0AAP9LCX5_9GAMM|nr:MULTISPECIES: phosphoribosylglycinamide formyltransferase [Pectobacterium]GKW43801.1 phosphoribosylglycinamide formyltransferase [Pectobacterium carotovorum subsp. carotovorum]KFX11366.1 phosphoribosylglycinamide formyltransferase [Pectobacterium parvum]KHS98634.1 phosphoribosylglycinamide formyltransferase [Pectobacterium parvum]MCU1803091.1 phosphoribosylglycinamide formyltransferase [Pectobacterium parvum]MDE8743808.1 phosphoribosylglycinamide formyltransferase [Pectobacterium polaris]